MHTDMTKRSEHGSATSLVFPVGQQASSRRGKKSRVEGTERWREEVGEVVGADGGKERKEGG